MRVARYSFLFVIGLVLTIGVTTAMANTTDVKKRAKNTGTLTVKTSPGPLRVKIDGQDAGPSGVFEPAEFYLDPGIHLVEVIGPNGAIFSREVEIRKDKKHCICLKIVEEKISRACPYKFHLEGPEKITEGDLVTFVAINGGSAPIPIRYEWRVSPNNVRVTSGVGTPTITVDSTGMGGKRINAELDVNDDVYDNRCRQTISVPTTVMSIPPPEVAKPFRCDEFESKAPDDDKARFDNCVIQAQNTPDAQLYIIVNPGTDRLSMTRNTYDRVSKRALDYMVKIRGFDPRRISVVRGSERQKTGFVVWIVPPGATPPPID